MGDPNSNFGYVTSYVNPDTDGVACCIAISACLNGRSGPTFEPIVFGALNDETQLVLKRFGWPTPRVVDAVEPHAKVVLVDTHHTAQLSPEIDPNSVFMIVDHHPGGDPEAFPNAEIENELVGAAATLVAERWYRDGLEMDSSIAGLLASAIVSNTLNLLAPTTTDRDRVMFERLRLACDIDEAFVEEMLQALSARSDLRTNDLLRSDFKIFPAKEFRIGITQIETARAAEVIDRKDLVDQLNELKEETGVDYCFMTVVDLAVGWTYTIVPDDRTASLLINAISVVFDEHGVARNNRIMLRKSDFVPQIVAWLDNDGAQ